MSKIKGQHMSYDPLYSMLCVQMAGWGKKEEATQNIMYSDTPLKVAKDLGSSTSSQVFPPGFQRGSMQN